MKKEIGGYFELELPKRNEYHKKAIALNSGRNCLKYILKSKKIKKLYIPNYICDSVLEPLIKLGIAYEFYNIDKNFELCSNLALESNERILYVNYFALKSKYIKSIENIYGTKLIIDNTHAFFDKQINNLDTFYSPRKFFGVCDGGYLYTEKNKSINISRDTSVKRAVHLLGRIDVDASSFFEKYQKSEQELSNVKIKKMSKLTHAILKSIDYKMIQKIRKKNFYFLHKHLSELNTIKISMDKKTIPFTYPFLLGKGDKIKKELIRKNIYLPTYWGEVLDRHSLNMYEENFVKNLIPLPVDQRYNLSDMKQIIKQIKKAL